MWAKVESGSVTELITRPKAMTIGDIQYPRNIFNLWSNTELKAIGIYPVVMDYTNRKDQGYYANTAITYTVVGNEVKGAYGTATALALTDVLFSAQDETDGLGTEGELKQTGLKTRSKGNINNNAASLLAKHDWMSIREAEGGTAMPSNIKTWRASVRTKANSMCTQIDNASDVDALAALYVYNSDDPPVRPLGEFPDEPS